MNERERAVSEALRNLDELHSVVISADWGNLRRHSFVSLLSDCRERLSFFREHWLAVEKHVLALPAGEKPVVSETSSELEKTISLLDKNLVFEKRKRVVGKEINLLEREETPELYTVLEQKLLSFLLKARHSLERSEIFFRKHSVHSLSESKGTSRNLLSLLEGREQELEALKSKYDSIRKKSFLGYIEEQTVADLEQEVSGLSRSVSSSIEKINSGISQHEKHLSFVESNYAELKQRLGEAEELFSSFMDKSFSVVSMLKKERDYARRVLLEMEHETVQLRSTYTRELLSLEEQKASAREEAKKSLGERIVFLEKALEKSEKDAEHFREIALEKREKIRELEEKIARFRHTATGKHSKKKN